MSKQAAKEGEKRPLPGSYSEMYPGRFLKADMLKGQKVTLTIKNIVGEGLMGGDGGANLEWIVSFAERPLEFVMNKTNATCLYRMFGGDPKTWIGKKITIFPTTTQAFGKTEPCIRIWGSPEIHEDLPITLPMGRKKLEMTMHKVGTAKAAAPAPTGVPIAEPRILAAMEILGWTPDERSAYMVKMEKFSTAEIVADLNRLVEERDNHEA